MIERRTLENLIQEKIHFRQISTGWAVGKCQLCGDHKERAGFKFTHNSVIYNCWNCSTSTVYEEFSCKISSKMRRVLVAHGIDDSEISSIVNSSFFSQQGGSSESKTITLDSVTKISTVTPTIKLPTKCFRLGYCDEFLEYQETLIKYLMSRKVDILKYAFFFSLEERFINTVIIPFYRNGQLVYWQARSITGDKKKKSYDNAPVSRECMLFNFDQLNSYSRLPLFITEGAFDAMMFDGVAVLGSKLNEAKIELIKKSPRRCIFVIDKDKNGRALAEDVLKRGWEISFAPEGAGDLNESVQRFGSAWTAYHIMQNIPKDADSARLAINLNCGHPV